MFTSEIESQAAFDRIRYAQLWEDADVLVTGLGDCVGETLVSICSAGDNALAMLTLDPERVVVVDLSPAQIACLHLRIGAYRGLTHAEFLELAGSRPSRRRRELLTRALAHCDPDVRVFWEGLSGDVEAHGFAGVGKFERYFRIFRTKFLPLVHSRRTIEAIFEPRCREDREVFFRARFSTLRWRFLLKLFFSRFVMARMGRDRAFFSQVRGSPARHVERRIEHAGVETDPSKNPYLRWIMTGSHGEALPLAWRAEHYNSIRSRLDRLDIRPGSLEAFVATAEPVKGFNLSDIFEYMSPAVFERLYESILSISTPGARLVYWNMMVPRRVPAACADRIHTLADLEDSLKARDLAFFYSDLVVEEVVG